MTDHRSPPEIADHLAKKHGIKILFPGEKPGEGYHLINITEDDAVALLGAKVDKLQETVERLASKLDAPESA